MKKFVCLLLAANLFLGCSDQDAISTATPEYTLESAKQVQTIPVNGLKIAKAPFMLSVSAAGIVKGANEAVVVSQTRGILDDVYVKKGQYIKKGEAIAGLDNTSEMYALNQAGKQLELAAISLDAARSRKKNGSISQAEFVRTESNYQAALLALNQAQDRFKARTISSPIAGYIASVEETVTPGNYVSPGIRVARIVDSSSLKLSTSFGEKEIRYVTVNAPVEIRFPSYSDITATGRVDAVAAASDQATGSFPVTIVWEDASGMIKPGMSAGAFIYPQENESVLIAPSQAVMEGPDGEFLWIAEDLAAKAYPVRTGRRVGNRSEIIEGVKEEMIVITSGFGSLYEGVPVAVSISGTTGDVQ